MEKTFQEKVFEKYSEENIEILNYINTKKPIKIQCLTCKKIYSYAQAGNLLKKNKKYICPECGKRKKNQENFTQSLKDIFPNEKFNLLLFQTTQLPMRIQCDECGKIYEYKQAMNIKSKKHICSNCHPFLDERWLKTLQYFEEFCENSKNWTLISELKGIHSQDLIECRCNYCGKINSKTVYDYLKGIGCTCSRWTTKENFVKSMGTEYKLLDEYTHIRKRVKIQHHCGFIYTVNPASFLRGENQCPQCYKKTSKGEKVVLNWLEKMNFEYEREFPVKIKGHLLRFDFYLPQLDIYIEYNGEQHYQVIDFFGGLENYKKRIYYDNLKKEYCEDRLIVISFEDFEKIESILDLEVQRLVERRTL